MPEKFGGGNYRYAYQGQEKDQETGFEAFELRQWDGRIGRWMSTDPYGQYASPYLGMGNNPVNGVDPDGGFFGWLRAGITSMFTGGDIQRNDFGDWLVVNGDRVHNYGGSWFGGVGVPQDAVAFAEPGYFGSYVSTSYDNSIANSFVSPANTTSEFINGGVNPNANFGINPDYTLETMLMPTSRIGYAKIPVYRVYGGQAGRFGNSWTFISPKLYGNTYRNFAGLPNVNSGGLLLKGSVRLKDINGFRMALPLDGNIGRFTPELLIHQSWNKVIWSSRNVSRTNF